MYNKNKELGLNAQNLQYGLGISLNKIGRSYVHATFLDLSLKYVKGVLNVDLLGVARDALVVIDKPFFVVEHPVCAAVVPIEHDALAG